MSKFTAFIDSLRDDAGTLAKAEIKKLISDAKRDTSDFVRLQAENLERWTILLADGELTPKGYKKLVSNMEVLTELEVIRLKVKAKASAQRLADGVQDLVVGQLFRVI